MKKKSQTRSTKKKPHQVELTSGTILSLTTLNEKVRRQGEVRLAIGLYRSAARVVSKAHARDRPTDNDDPLGTDEEYQDAVTFLLSEKHPWFELAGLSPGLGVDILERAIATGTRVNWSQDL